jgi:hypothetical protein
VTTEAQSLLRCGLSPEQNHLWESTSRADASCTSLSVQTARCDKNGAVNRAGKKRALYPGGRPSPEAKAIHRRFATRPIPRVLPVAAVLEVRGRRSGRGVRVPLAIVRYRRSWYLVSMFGEGSNWVKNVRASDGEVVLTHGRRRAVRLVEVPVPDRPPIIRRYLLSLPQEPHTQVRWKDPLPAFQVVAAIYPVFRVDHR